MLDSPGGGCDVFGLLGEELSQPAGLGLQAVVVVAGHSQHEAPLPQVRAPVPHHDPDGVLAPPSQTPHQLQLQHRLGVPGQSGVSIITDTPLGCGIQTLNTVLTRSEQSRFIKASCGQI